MRNVDNRKDAQDSMVAAIEVFHHEEGDLMWSQQWHSSPETLPHAAWNARKSSGDDHFCERDHWE